MSFLVDTNIFVDAHRRYYGFDIVPSFWEFLDQQFGSGALVSIKPVLEKLKEGNNALADWAKNRPLFFKEIDDTTIQAMVQIADWAEGQSYTQSAVDEFLSVADFYLVAFAAANGHTVLVNKQPSPGAKKRVLIPNVCNAFGVRYADTFQMDAYAQCFILKFIINIFRVLAQSIPL